MGATNPVITYIIVISFPKSPQQRITAMGFIMGEDVMNASVGPRYAPE
jgi:Fe2+ transport system protein FeoA